MKILDKVISFFTRRKKTKFEQVNNLIVVVLGILAFLVAGYLGLLLSKVVPEFVAKVVEVGFSMSAITLASLLGFIGLLFWYFGCIAARCHSLLYERWFK